MSLPRPEYPRPQFVRDEWLCLNGKWQFEIDQGDSGLERGLLERDLKSEIKVPFCPESELSGIGNPDFLNAVWYRRDVTIPETWADRRVLLHFQAVDYETTVWVNGSEVGRHRGGFSPFTCDLGVIAEPGESVTLVVRARDNRYQAQPRGKQAQTYGPWGAIYVRTTGIWQSVWMEPVPDCALLRPRITPDVGNNMIRLEQALSRSKPGAAPAGDIERYKRRGCNSWKCLPMPISRRGSTCRFRATVAASGRLVIHTFTACKLSCLMKMKMLLIKREVMPVYAA